MFGNEHLTHCQQRKAALLQQSTTHCLALMTEAQHLRPIAEWMDVESALPAKRELGGVSWPSCSLFGDHGNRNLPDSSTSSPESSR